MPTPPTSTRRRPGRPPGQDPRHPARREAILEAACRAILQRGFPATRITDVAQVAGTSTGTIHYYFETRDEVLLEALKWAAERLFARIEAGARASARARLSPLLAVSTPAAGPARDEYVLWIELWLRVLHDPRLLPDCEALSARWRSYFLPRRRGRRGGRRVRTGRRARGGRRPAHRRGGRARLRDRARLPLDVAGAHAGSADGVRRRAARRPAGRAPGGMSTPPVAAAERPGAATAHGRLGGHVVAESLALLGAEAVFGVPGIHALAIWEGLRA